MKSGAWHQFGDKSQKLALEQLQLGRGVGVIISPRDLAQHGAEKYAAEYTALGAEVLFDPQFFKPDANVGKLATYDLADHRQTLSEMKKLDDEAIKDLSETLRKVNHNLGTSAVIAPAVLCEAGHPESHEINNKLLGAARSAGEALGLPVYATIFLGRSITTSDKLTEEALSRATSTDADGWYFAFEFNAERIPSSCDDVIRCGKAQLALACTGKPVLHAYAGPIGLLSPGFGATGVGIGHSQNLWQLTPDRWEAPTADQGGGGDAPARYFSEALWGTIVHPDETVQLPKKLKDVVFVASPFTSPLDRWSAGKHLVYTICGRVGKLAKIATARAAASEAGGLLKKAVAMHKKIAEEGVELKDNTDAYQQNWRVAVGKVLQERSEDYDILELS